jgi:hypothetical protein
VESALVTTLFVVSSEGSSACGLESSSEVVLAAGLVNVFCIYLRTNSDLCHLQHKLIGFYNRDEKCLQRGTNWVFNL